MMVFTELSGPLRGTWNGLPMMIIGVFGDGGVLIVDGEGILKHLQPSATENDGLQADVRYSYDDRKWLDVDEPEK